MPRADERFEALTLASHTDLSARQDNITADKIHRAIMRKHAEMFGLPLAMMLLFRKPLPTIDTQIRIARPHRMWALDASQYAVSRYFYPSKIPGTCSACGGFSCTFDGAPITPWGYGWARFECWASEIAWLDSYEIKRREVLTALYKLHKENGWRYQVENVSNRNWEAFEAWLMDRERRKGETCDDKLTVKVHAVDNATELLRRRQNSWQSALSTEMARRVDEAMGFSPAGYLVPCGTHSPVLRENASQKTIPSAPPENPNVGDVCADYKWRKPTYYVWDGVGWIGAMKWDISENVTPEDVRAEVVRQHYDSKIYDYHVGKVFGAHTINYMPPEGVPQPDTVYRFGDYPGEHVWMLGQWWVLEDLPF